MKRLAIAAMAVLAVAVPAVQVDAWGNTGHRLIGVAAGALAVVRRAPMVVAIMVAMAVTALVRLVA